MSPSASLESRLQQQHSLRSTRWPLNESSVYRWPITAKDAALLLAVLAAFLCPYFCAAQRASSGWQISQPPGGDKVHEATLAGTAFYAGRQTSAAIELLCRSDSPVVWITFFVDHPQALGFDVAPFEGPGGIGQSRKLVDIRYGSTVEHVFASGWFQSGERFAFQSRAPQSLIAELAHPEAGHEINFHVHDPRHPASTSLNGKFQLPQNVANVAAMIAVCRDKSSSETPVPVFAGVVEQLDKTAGIRILFRRDAAGWHTAADACADRACLAASVALYPKQMRWSLLQYGQVSSSRTVVAHTPAVWRRYIDQGLQQVQPTSLRLSGGTLASSGPVLRDPDRWHQSTFPPLATAAVRAAFRREFPDVRNCAQQLQEPMEAKRWSYSDRDIRFRSSLASARGWRLIRADLTGYRCDGIPPPEFLAQWFAIAPQGPPIALQPSGLTFVGAADLDNNGSSELLFANHDNGVTYFLFSSDFKKLAQAQFVAH